MKTIACKVVIRSDRQLHLAVPEDIPPGPAEVILVIAPDIQPKKGLTAGRSATLPCPCAVSGKIARTLGIALTYACKRGVGLDTMSEFFARLHLQTQAGCSPSALRQVMRTLEDALLETAEAWEQDGCAGGEVREIIGAVDETFLERMMLVCLDLSTGYLLLETVAEDRTFATWQALLEERLKVLGTSVRYLVSDRAQALVQLAEQGLECLSMPDFFHVVHDIVKSDSLAIRRHVRQAQQALTHAEEVCVRLQEQPHRAHEVREAQALVAARQAEVQHWSEVSARIATTWRRCRSPCIRSASPTRLPKRLPGRQSAARGCEAIEEVASASSCQPVTAPCRRSANRSPPWQPSSIIGGKASSTTWSTQPSLRRGGTGPRSACCPGLLGAPRGSHTTRAQKSQDTAGLRGGAGHIAHA